MEISKFLRQPPEANVRKKVASRYIYSMASIISRLFSLTILFFVSAGDLLSYCAWECVSMTPYHYHSGHRHTMWPPIFKSQEHCWQGYYIVSVLMELTAGVEMWKTMECAALFSILLLAFDIENNSSAVPLRHLFKEKNRNVLLRTHNLVWRFLLWAVWRRSMWCRLMLLTLLRNFY